MSHINMTSRLSVLLVVLGVMSLSAIQGQIAINSDGSPAHSSAILELKANDAGFIMPRMNESQRTGLSTVTEGLMVYQMDGEPGFYLYTQGQWENISALETYRGNINMGIAPTVISGSITPAMVSTIATGHMRVDFPSALASDYTVMITSEFLPNPSAPVADEDYCDAFFTGSCTGSHETWEVGVFTPAGSTASELNTFFTSYSGPTTLSNMIWHYPTLAGAGCNSTSDNYHYHPSDGSVTEGPSSLVVGPTDIYNDPYDLTGVLGFNVTGLINSVPAGTACDIVVTGNEQNTSNVMGMSVFIDWNSDGDFFDNVDGIPELVISTPRQSWPQAGVSGFPGYADGVNVFTVTVPPSAVNGNLTMRTMATRFNNNTGPCMTDSDGSTRDYDFAVSGGTTPVRPGQARTCNVHNYSLSGFEVRCFDHNGAPIDNKVYLTINP